MRLAEQVLSVVVVLWSGHKIITNRVYTLILWHCLGRTEQKKQHFELGDRGGLKGTNQQHGVADE